MVMLFSSLGLAFANEENTKLSQNDEEMMILVEKGMPRLITHDELQRLYPMNISEQVSNNEYETVLNDSFSEHDEDVITPNSMNWYTYSESSGFDILDYADEKEVTPVVSGGEDGSSISYGWSKTHSSTFQFGLTSTKINAILSGLGASYTRSASNSESFGATFHIGAGKQARIMFVPMKRSTQGKIKYWRQLEGESQPRLISEESTSANVIKKVGSWADRKSVV